MEIRKAFPHEHDAIYAMGFLPWGDDLTMDQYLDECRESKKYQSGEWYVLLVEDTPVASLVIYKDLFNLEEKCFGIGSVATAENEQGKGYASRLVKTITQKYLASASTQALFLHSDIEHKFYERFGYKAIGDSDCMFVSNDANYVPKAIPEYF